MTVTIGSTTSSRRLPLQADFRRFVRELLVDYSPAAYEIDVQNELYGRERHQNWAVRHSGRFHHALTTLAPYFHDGAVVLDVGAYPGSLLKLIRRYFDVRLVAAGMPVAVDFPDDMARLDIAFVPVDLDSCGRTPYPARLSLPDASVDVVICTEMIEHLYSVRPLLEEVRRVLRPGGVLYVSTNNVAYLLGIFRLFTGETNLDVALDHTSALADTEWRGHVRFYSLRQLRELAEHFGLRILNSGYLQCRAPREVVASKAVWRWRLSRVFDFMVSVTPRYQSHIWALVERPAALIEG